MLLLPPLLLLVPLATDITLDTKELDNNISDLMTASSPHKDHMFSTQGYNSLEDLMVLLLPLLPLLPLVNKVPLPLLLLPPLEEMPPLLPPLPLEEMLLLLLLPLHRVRAWDLSLDSEV